MFGAAYGHIRETILRGNFETYNFYMIFVDAFIALYLLILVYLHYRITRSNKSNAEFQSYH